MTTHEELEQQAKAAADKLFSDTSVSPEGTAESLRELIMEIEEMIESLQL